jgi:hypothetical protein
MKAWSIYILVSVGLILSGSAPLARSAPEVDYVERYYPSERYPSYPYRYSPVVVIPDANLYVPGVPLTAAERSALNSRAANDGDITTNPGVKARIDRDITTQPGRKDPFDRDITKRRDR